ncbi:MAG: type II secretion system F family protein [candidate division Zixibacteria bacterium]|nr:type II secretion system F family protein [candidate division Zixibacteria bacterium]
MLPEFNYRAVDRTGISLSGTMQAETASEVSLRLDRMGYIPLLVERKTDGILQAFRWGGRRVPLSDLIVFTRQLSTLYRAGIPILRALAVLSAQADHPELRTAIEQVRSDLEAGVTLAEAFLRQEKVFGKLFVSSIKTGEATGHFDQVLDRLSEFMEREMKTKEDLKDALRYPTLVVIALAAAFVILVAFVFPKFAFLFSRFHTELPLPTRILMGISVFIRGYWYFLIPPLFFAGYFFKRWLTTDRGEVWLDERKLKLPILGVIFLKVAMSRFAHMLSVLVKSGLPIIQSLQVVRGAIGNRSVADEIERLEAGMVEGKEPKEIMERSPVFPPLAAQMFSVGSESGALDRMLTEMAFHYDQEVAYATRRLSKLVEPALTVVLGATVLLFALSVFLPVWNLLNVFRK